VADQPEIAVVIPTLDCAAALAATLAHLAATDDGVVGGVVVADGGSRDGTVAVARMAGAQVIEAVRGRGSQLRAGAEAARGDWFLFLHADTRPAPGWPAAVRGFVAHVDPLASAAAFRFRLDDDRPAARRLETMVRWRSRVLALPYGDQGLLIHRALYERIGGYRPLPLMEDVDIIRRLGRRRLVLLAVDAVTSAERYRRDGYLCRSLRNLACLGLYFLGVPPRLIARLYA